MRPARLLFVIIAASAALWAYLRFQSAAPFDLQTLDAGLRELVNRHDYSTGARRVLTDLRGRRITAEILEATPTTVTIRRVADGQCFTIQLGLLCADDRAFLDHWRTARIQ